MSPKKKVEPFLCRNKKKALFCGVGSGVGLAFAESYFPKATNTIRIASAYFHFDGFNLIKEKIKPRVQLRVIVRIRDGGNSSAQVRKTAVEAVDEIIKQLGECKPLVESIRYIFEKMEKDEFFIHDAHEAEPFHSKYFVFDESLLWHGSANLSNNGLTVNIENVSLITKADAVQGFIKSFDTLSKNSRDLLELLREKLKNWLELANPFDIYLKTLFLLFKTKERKPLLEGAHAPNYYQKEIIEKGLIKINKYGGVLIVAATGLGKTIMGSEIAYMLAEKENITQIILLAPSNVHRDWRRELFGRHIRSRIEYFDIGIPFLESSDNDLHAISKLEDCLGYDAEETLIIVDEAHIYRNQLLNQYKKETEKEKKHQKVKDRPTETRVLDRIVPIVAKGAKIVLLTATVYSTSSQNNNTLLYLLPHKSGVQSNEPWTIKSVDDSSLSPPIIEFGYPDALRMAENKRDIDNQGRDFFPFSDGNRYLPKEIVLWREDFQLPLEDNLLKAFEAKAFHQKGKNSFARYSEESMNFQEGACDSTLNRALKYWISSFAAMKECLEKNLLITDEAPNIANRPSSDDAKKIAQALALIPKNSVPYGARMLKPQIERQKSLSGNYIDFCKLKSVSNSKLSQLESIIKKRCIAKKGKVLIFVNFLLTALEVQERISELFAGKLKTACTVKKVNGKAILRSSGERSQILKSFSPGSQAYKPTDRLIEEYDVLICTDAEGVGVNLQDADTVVNYDLPTGADVLFQRVGRILRMTKNPDRIVHIHTFFPSLLNEPIQQFIAQTKIQSFFDQLRRREGNSRSESLLGTKILSLKKQERKPLSAKEIEEIVTAEKVNNLSSETSSSHHMSILESKEDSAAKIPDYIFSARAHPTTTPQVFVLFKHKEDYFPIIYDIEGKFIKILEKFEALDLLKCETDCEIASVDVERLKNSEDNGIGIIEVEVLKAAEKLCKKLDISIQSIIKVCALYLVSYKKDKPREIFGNLRKNKSVKKVTK